LQKKLDGFCDLRGGNRHWQKHAVVFAIPCELWQCHENDLNTWTLEVRHARESETV
jgi:hypothetical protein